MKTALTKKEVLEATKLIKALSDLNCDLYQNDIDHKDMKWCIEVRKISFYIERLYFFIEGTMTKKTDISYENFNYYKKDISEDFQKIVEKSKDDFYMDHIDWNFTYDILQNLAN